MTCKELGVKLKGIKIVRAEDQGSYGKEGSCLIDFVTPKLAPEVRKIVDCNTGCRDAIDYKDYEVCMEQCNEQIDKSLVGSVFVSDKTKTIHESTIPISCKKLTLKKQAMVGNLAPAWYGKKTETLFKKLEEVGCQKTDFEWIHPHSFGESGKNEKEPAICYLHMDSGDELGKCRLPDVWRVLFGKL